MKSKDNLWKVFFITGGCKILLRKNLSQANAVICKNVLQRLYSDWCGKFIIQKT